MTQKTTILIVEDERDIREVISWNLKREGYTVFEAETAEKGLELVERAKPDLVLLDMMLPGVDGLSALKTIRNNASTAELPLIMVTARSEDADIVAGLELGADDYICKPFSPRVLIARIRARLREREGPALGGGIKRDGEPEILESNGIRLDPQRHEVFLDGEELALSVTEFSLLEYLMANPGRVFSRQRIINALHGPDYPVTDRSIDVQVLSLRKKLLGASEFVETVRGVGYRWKDGTRR